MASGSRGNTEAEGGCSAVKLSDFNCWQDMSIRLWNLSDVDKWSKMDSSQLEEELKKKEKEYSWVSQSVDIVVGGCLLNCTQRLLLFSPEVIVFPTVVASMSAVKLVLFSDDLILSSYLHGVDM